MIGRPRHLHDDRLYDCYLTSRQGEALDPRAADHLADCAPCATRYRELTTFLEQVGREGAAEADEVFTAETLLQQQHTILQRLEHTSRPARVISFPGHAAPPAHPPVSRMATRWLAAAAAAGLFVGVAVGGTFLPSRAASNRPVTRVNTTPSIPRPVPAAMHLSAPAQSAEPIDDDRFLLELELALQRPHTRELLSFDNLTPHVRDVSTRVR